MYPPDSYGFHAYSGLYFKRLPNGFVQITTPPADGTDGHPIWVIDDGTWASVVCSVSDRGESDYRWYQALAFHTVSKTQQWLACVGDPIRYLFDKVADGFSFSINKAPFKFRSEIMRSES